MLIWIVPRIAAPAASATSGELLGALWRPVVPAVAAGVVVLVVVARVWDPQTLLALVPLGALWAVVASALIWRFGLASRERDQFRRELRPGRAAAAPVEL
jgi:hypothetical protein